MKTDITLLVAPFGFGSLGKGLAIASELIDRGYSIRVLCDPVAQKVVEDSGIPCGNYQYRETLRLDELNTRLVISSGDVGTPLVKGNTPLLVVDSLFWLRGKWERLPSTNADIYIAQRFFIEATNAAKMAIGNRLKFVDAILPSWAQNAGPSEVRDLITVYPGGMRSPVLTQEYQEKYLMWVSDVVCDAIQKIDIDGKKLVAVIPPHLINTKAAQKFSALGHAVSAGANVLEDLFSKTQHLIVAPGIETMLEACAVGLKPHFLPAYNGSHIPQLIGYRQACVGDEICPSYALELRGFETETDWLNKLTMDLSHKNLQSLLNPSYKSEAVTHLVKIFSNPEQHIKQYPLGRDGSSQIADIVDDLLSSKVAPHEVTLVQNCK